MVLFGLGSVAYFCLLLINSVAILNKERFLVPLGLTSTPTNAQASFAAAAGGGGGGPPHYNQGFDTYGAHSPGVGGTIGSGSGGGGGDDMSIKLRLVTLVDAVRTLMRIPLIPINIAVIVYELLFG